MSEDENRTKIVEPELTGDDPESPEASKREEAEYNNLLAETAYLEAQRDEISQRGRFRIYGAALATAVILGMFWAFCTIIDLVFGFRYILLSPAAMVWMIIAPLASITSVTIALLFGVFRGFKEADAKAAGAAIAASVTAAKGS